MDTCKEIQRERWSEGKMERGRERESRLFLWSRRVKLTCHVFHWFVQ